MEWNRKKIERKQIDMTDGEGNLLAATVQLYSVLIKKFQDFKKKFQFSQYKRHLRKNLRRCMCVKNAIKIIKRNKYTINKFHSCQLYESGRLI